MALFKSIIRRLVDNSTLTLNTNSAVFDTADHPYVTLFGTATVTATLRIYYSDDGTTFFDTGLTIALTSATPFNKDWTPAARYIAVQVSATQTSGFTLVAAAKGGS